MSWYEGLCNQALGEADKLPLVTKDHVPTVTDDGRIVYRLPELRDTVIIETVYYTERDDTVSLVHVTGLTASDADKYLYNIQRSLTDDGKPMSMDVGKRGHITRVSYSVDGAVITYTAITAS